MSISSRIRPIAASSAMAFVTVAMLVEPAFAQAAGIETILQNVVDLLQGNIFRLFATIAVILIALAWMFGYLDLRKAAYVVLGVAIVFGASEIVSTLTGGS